MGMYVGGTAVLSWNSRAALGLCIGDVNQIYFLFVFFPFLVSNYCKTDLTAVGWCVNLCIKFVVFPFRHLHLNLSSQHPALTLFVYVLNNLVI